RTVEPDRRRLSYGEEETFEHDLRDGNELRRRIAAHAESVARRLRADNRAGRTVVLKLKLHRRIAPGKYPLLTRRLTLATPTDDGKTIGDAALRLWDAIKQGTTIRLIGVSVTGIDDDAGANQLALFDDGPRRQQALNKALDVLAERFGSGTVSRGGTEKELISKRGGDKDRAEITQRREG